MALAEHHRSTEEYQLGGMALSWRSATCMVGTLRIMKAINERKKREREEREREEREREEKRKREKKRGRKKKRKKKRRSVSGMEGINMVLPAVYLVVVLPATLDKKQTKITPRRVKKRGGIGR